MIIIAPPLVINQEELKEGLNGIDQALIELRKTL
jgi:4-aminobutyrate aminotransferase-like enzyme